MGLLALGNVVLLGGPGSGKGTQAELMHAYFGVPIISTGNIIRDEQKRGTELGNQVSAFIGEGKLVPDNMVIDIVKGRLSQDDCAHGFILDGFPRNIFQAEALDRMNIIIDSVINLEVDDAIIIDRMSGRRTCSNCGNSYHVRNKKPQVDNVCDSCKGTLFVREDDTLETVKKRLAVYHDETTPLEEYYERQGKLITINGNGSIEEISEKIVEALRARE